ncbi:MAG TPA: glycosyltransferase family 2 protein, partial [Dehalococcoidia bacterium]|nr:glycosyltransferase family 2 protein [Dehalococcoidia bacterium]
MANATVVPMRRGPVGRLLPNDPADRIWLRRFVIRVLIATNMLLGVYYLAWRLSASINWSAWPIALALLGAELYSFMGSLFFGVSMWKLRERGAARPAPPGKTVDLFITCYNEPVAIVRETVRRALAVRYPHATYVLDDGNSPAMRAMTEEEGCGYIVRSADWSGKQRHAKAGNLNNALFQTTGEFIIILDADQLAHPALLDQTLAYFDDPRVAFVQTPQPFYNVPEGDPFGSHAPLFYGPIQQGKDGWNAAFFCGSNAVLRREALMQLGLVYYGRELERRVRRALRTADGVLRGAAPRLDSIGDPNERQRVRNGLQELHAAVRTALTELRAGTPVQVITWEFQRAAEAVARSLVQADLAQIGAELAELGDLPEVDAEKTATAVHPFGDDDALAALTSRDASPLAAIGAVHTLLLAVDMDRADEAQPLMPMATISVTEDMATAMRLHSMGWTSIYHHEELAQGLAPEDLGTALQQRLRWAQGTLQVLLRENPLTLAGLSLGQRLMYLSTMWSYLSGFFTVVYLIAPMLYLTMHISPIRAFSGEFYWHLFPFL